MDEARFAVFDGVAWQDDAVAISPNGAATQFRVIEFDHVVAAGATSQTTGVIPAGEQVIGISGQVLSGLDASGATSWELGVSGSTNRYGSSLGLSAGSWIRGLTSAPLTYWSDTPLLMTAVGGSFSSGSVRFAIHTVALKYPRGS